MKIIKTGIDGVVILEAVRFGDGRGWFAESFAQRGFTETVCDTVFVQDNDVTSRRGVVRGLHWQMPPHAQAKLVRVARGRIVDVAVDVRRGSPTFGRHVAVELSAENGRQLFVPRGFGHGYSVLEDDTVVVYKCDNYYAPESEAGVRFDDPALGIDWGVAEPLISDKDRVLPVLADARLFDYTEKFY